MTMEAKKYLYAQVYEDLKQKISTGVFTEGNYLPSEREIGDFYTVDRTTVRKALKLLATEGLIEKKAGAGSQIVNRKGPPPPSMRATKRSIAFLLPRSSRKTHRISQPFYAALFYRLEEECRQHHYSLVYSVLEQDDDLAALLDTGEHAGIVFVSNVARKFIDYVKAQHVPSVLINDYYEPVVSIHTDNINGMMLACDHLIALGHRHFGIVTGAEGYLSTNERMLACIASFSKAGLRIQEQYIEHTNWEAGEGYEAAKRILSRGKRPTALIGFNDNLAMECMQAASEYGLHIPEDISVMGFDDLGHAQYTVPPLSTVHQHIKPMARAAMQNLLIQIKNPNEKHNIRMTTPCSLVLRHSTAPPKTGLVP